MKTIITTLFIFFIYSFSFSQVYIYWTDATNDNINRAKLDGSGQEEVLGFQNTPRGITIDYEHGKFYFADGQHQTITSANLDGTDVVYLNYTPEPIDVFYDKSSGYIYYSDVESASISKIKPDGTGETVIISNQIKPAFFDIDLVNKRIYYCSRQGEKSVIYRADLDGTDIKKIIDESGYITGVAVDPFNKKIYWLNRETAKLHYADIDGNNKADLADASPACIALKLDKINNKLYWAEKDVYKIQSINTDGSNYKTFMEDVKQVGGIALDINNECRKITEVTDTVIVYNTITIYDTISVTDTLYIDVDLTSIIGSPIVNKIKVYPNPTHKILNINTGSHFSDINNYSLKIVTTTGTKIFESKLNQSLFSIDISNFGSTGLFLLYLIDDNGNIIKTKKIVLY